MMQSKDSLEYSHYESDKDPFKHSKDSFQSSQFSSSKRPYYKSNDPIRISDEENLNSGSKEGFSTSNRYKDYEQAIKIRDSAEKEADYRSSQEKFAKMMKFSIFLPEKKTRNFEKITKISIFLQMKKTGNLRKMKKTREIRRFIRLMRL